MKSVVVITGASGGIGSACAKRFASLGCKVYNLSRHGESNEYSEFIKADVTDEESVASAFEKIIGESGRIDVLVNNAGYGIAGAVEFTDTEKAKRQFDVNFFGAFSCAKLALPYIKSSRGRIIFISSAAALFPIPFQSFYSASKAAVNSLSQALSNELRAFGVTASTFMLGDARTGFTSAREKLYQGDDVYGGRIAKSVAVMENDEKNGMPPEKIAVYICKKTMGKRMKALYTVGAGYKLLAFAARLLPNNFINKAIGALYIKK